MNRNGISDEQRDLAQQIVAYEVTLPRSPEVGSKATSPVIETLRLSLTTLVGNIGFCSLLTRALTLAQREAPALSAVKVKDDGTMEGLTGEAVEANVLLVTHLIALLTKFIGETLTLRLLRDAWPEMVRLKEPSGETDQP